MERFDFVVVGAGSAGRRAGGAAVRGSRQSSVLLLEAGPDHTSAETPAGIAGLSFFDALAVPGRLWPDLVAIRKQGQPATLYPRGRGVGGSSAVNGMMAIRGTPEDYDRWARELGCPGWSWADLLPSFLALEDDADYGGDDWHGRGGPIPLWRIPTDDLPPLDVAIRTAALSLGYGESDDYHAPGATGVSRVALNLRDRRRVSTNDAYLEPARSRANLTIRGDVLVDRVALDGRRAVGVVTASGEDVEAGEVIVCAGAIHSPAILLRSGIGPEVGLPVGANLADHASTAGFELALKPEGRMVAAALPLCGSMVRYSSGMADAGDNDMQIVWFNGLGATEEGCQGGRLIGAVMRVFSRGLVRLRSTDPLDDPIVDFRLLSDGRDLARLRDAVRRLVDIVRQPAVAAVTDAVTAGPDSLETLTTDEAIDAWLASNVNDYVHAGRDLPHGHSRGSGRRRRPGRAG